jgi:hypothetical protein
MKFPVAVEIVKNAAEDAPETQLTDFFIFLLGGCMFNKVLHRRRKFFSGIFHNFYGNRKLHGYIVTQINNFEDENQNQNFHMIPNYNSQYYIIM